MRKYFVGNRSLMKEMLREWSLNAPQTVIYAKGYKMTRSNFIAGLGLCSLFGALLALAI